MKHLITNLSAGNSVLTPQPEGTGRIPRATERLRTREWNPAPPHFPGNGRGKWASMGHLGYVRGFEMGLGPEATKEERKSFTGPG